MSAGTGPTPATRSEGAEPRDLPPHPMGERGHPEPATPGARDGRSTADLLRALSSEGSELVRQELALARAELNEKLDLFQSRLTSMAVGGALLLAALLFFLWAVNSGLTALLAQVVSLEIAVWLSPLLLAGVLALVGRGMMSSAARDMKKEGVTPSRTKKTLEADTRWARNKAREMKEEMAHG